MTTLHIRNLEIVTLDEGGTLHHGADLVVRDGRLSHLGPAPADLQADEVVDGRGKAALPGLVNAHCHSPMTFERGWAEDLPFERWLNEKIWGQESVLTSAEGRIRTFVGPHSPYVCSEEVLRRAVELAHELGVGIHLHLAETDQQVQQSLEHYR